MRPTARQFQRIGTIAAKRRWRTDAATQTGGQIMLGWALTFLVVALIAAVLGFGGIAGLSIEIAKIIFFVALILFVISAVFGLVTGRSAPAP